MYTQSTNDVQVQPPQPPNAAVVKDKDGNFHRFLFYKDSTHHDLIKAPPGDPFHALDPMDVAFLDYSEEAMSGVIRDTLELARADVTALHQLPITKLGWVIQYVHQLHYCGIDIELENPDAPQELNIVNPH